ncbi:hypothetical protein DFJ74DRAFT_733746 [Hyaloraphidium curvatum]|nr:hypothetical protein DFJ74DRAFT_733746 [Hyaloraphidium curvatum]
MARAATWKDFDRGLFCHTITEAVVGFATFVSSAADRFLATETSSWPRLWAAGIEAAMDKQTNRVAGPQNIMLPFFRNLPGWKTLGVHFFPGGRVPADGAPQALRNDVGLEIFGRAFHTGRQAALQLAEMASAVGWKPLWDGGRDATGAPDKDDPLYKVYRGFFVMAAEFLVFRILADMAMSEMTGRRLSRDVEFLDLAADLMLLMRPAVDAGGLHYPAHEDGSPSDPAEVALMYTVFLCALLPMFGQSTATTWAEHSAALAKQGLRAPAYHLLDSLNVFLDSLPPGDRSQEECDSLHGNLSHLQLLLSRKAGDRSCPCCRERVRHADLKERCDECGKAAGSGVKLRKCGRCKTAHYCSVECQKRAWAGGHRKVCTEVKKAEGSASGTTFCLRFNATVDGTVSITQAVGACPIVAGTVTGSYAEPADSAPGAGMRKERTDGSKPLDPNR